MVGMRMRDDGGRIHTGTVQKQIGFRKVNSVISQVFYLQELNCFWPKSRLVFLM